MIGDIYAFQLTAGSPIHYCRVLDETPRSARVVIIRGRLDDEDPPGGQHQRGGSPSALDTRPLTKPFYVFKRDGCLVRGQWRFTPLHSEP